MSPDVIMLVLLPPLLYAAAAGCSWHTFRRSLWPILTLSFPAVAFSCVAIAASFKRLVPGTDEWSFAQALTLGAILAATDPVAVVSALHELGAPAK